MFAWKQCSYQSAHDLKSVVQWYVKHLARCLTSWCVRCATKASVVRWSVSIVRVARWSDHGTCVNAIGRTANVRSCEPSCVCSHMSWYSSYAPSGEDALEQQHNWFCLDSQVLSEKKILWLYVTCNGNTPLQDHLRHVLKNSHGRKTHAYKCGNQLATLEIRETLLRLIQPCVTLCECSWDPTQQFESPSVASEFRTCSKFRGDLMRPFYRIKQMRRIVQRQWQDVRIAKFTISRCSKAAGSQLWKPH